MVYMYKYFQPQTTIMDFIKEEEVMEKPTSNKTISTNTNELTALIDVLNEMFAKETNKEPKKTEEVKKQEGVKSDMWSDSPSEEKLLDHITDEELDKEFDKMSEDKLLNHIVDEAFIIDDKKDEKLTEKLNES